MTDWLATKNLAGVDQGNFRSILGYAGESLVIGRALIAGYNLFFKAWRDSKYDAVMDVAGSLYRIEIKQTGDGKAISSTSGGRSGQQISRSAGSRQQVLSTVDSDFLIAVHSMSGVCWVIPTEVIELRLQNSLPTKYLSEYKERWDIFQGVSGLLTVEDIRRGFRDRPLEELVAIATALGNEDDPRLFVLFHPRTKRVLKSYNDWYVLKIWELLYRRLQED
jgi:hypothetical protein